jgi:DNA ligase-1
MPDLQDGETIEMKGSAAKPYVIRNVGGVYSCSCPAWRNQSLPIEQRTCKHIRKLRGDEAEKQRVGSALTPRRAGKTGKKGPPLLLAEKWDNATDLADWWMSEKLDGVRAYWDGKQLLSRQGNVYHAPDWFLKGLPNEPLDGELWMDRKSFQRTVSIVRRQDKSDHWKQIRLLVFDAPEHKGDFETRLEFLSSCLSPKRTPHAQILEHQVCEGLKHLKKELDRVESLGGEGLMLREPRSAYEVGRSSTLLKIKTFHDAEAIVLDHQGGKGRHKGRLGALIVQLDDGTEFSVGTGFSDAQREDPPPVGSTITFRYQELSDRGVPRFPSFVRTRKRAKETQAPKPKKPAKAKPVAETSKAKSGKTRTFEFSDGKSNKFWEISIDGTDVTVRYGKIGTDGRTQVKSLSDAEAAIAHAEKLIEQKTGKGYAESKGV